MAETKFGMFEELMAATTPAMQPIARRLREIIVGTDPDYVEGVRLGDRAATFGGDSSARQSGSCGAQEITGKIAARRGTPFFWPAPRLY
jgi:hypothetical protein